MSLDWMDVSTLSFNTLLLLETAQLNWFPGWGFPRPALEIALRANPAVAWFLRHKCPNIAAWVDEVLSAAPTELPAPEAVRQAEVAVLSRITDLLVYATDPAVYDRQPFLGWDTRELTGMADFSGKLVIDVGAGTGRLALAVAPQARVVFAVEPVGNLRAYLRDKARRLGCANVYPVDGLITALPFPDGFADITMGGHVFGDEPAAELAEMERTTRSGGSILLCPGNTNREDEVHWFLVESGFDWERFEEPRDGWKRKYWKVKR